MERARQGREKLLDKTSVKCSWNHVLHGCFLCCMGNSVCRFECVEWEKGNECVFMREKEEGEILIPVIWQTVSYTHLTLPTIYSV